MTTDRDFQKLARCILRQARTLLPQWFPNGVFLRNEFKVGNLSGAPAVRGGSLSVNISTGKWADFAEDKRGGDLISLYAAKENISQVEAYDALNSEMPTVEEVTRARSVQPEKDRLGAPPEGVVVPKFVSSAYGPASAAWAYTDAASKILFYITRHDPPEGRKQFLPWSWSLTRGMWINAAWKERPLFGVDGLAHNPKKHVLVVEGEKCVEALRKINCPYVVTTWSGGAQALRNTDLEPLHGRSLLLWPDADPAGVKAMDALAEALADRAAEIKIINVGGQPTKWDAADAVTAGWDWPAIANWAKNRVSVWAPKTTLEKQQSTQAERDRRITDRAELWESLGLTLGPSMQPCCNIDNMAKVLERWDPFAGTIWLNSFSEKVMTTYGAPNKLPRQWTDADDLTVTRAIQAKLEIPKTTVPIVHDAVQLVAQMRLKNPLEEFLNSAENEWDGTPRLEGWLSSVFGCHRTLYTDAVGRCWLISMVARAYRPGCKVDTMPILEGGQGVGKSSALAILGGEYFTECHESITSKDFFGVLQGKWLVEISEMHSFSRSEKERIKGIISCQTDRYRSPYGRNTMDHPRKCVFAGTTNRTDWNNDETGARRFWPITCGQIDLAWLRQHRTQLLGEAVVKFKRGDLWWDIPFDEHRDETARRYAIDTWEEVLAERLDEEKEYTTAELLSQFVGLELARHDRRSTARIKAIMTRMGWHEIFPKDLSRKTIRRWKR